MCYLLHICVCGMRFAHTTQVTSTPEGDLKKDLPHLCQGRTPERGYNAARLFLHRNRVCLPHRKGIRDLLQTGCKRASLTFVSGI